MDEKKVAKKDGNIGKVVISRGTGKSKTQDVHNISGMGEIRAGLIEIWKSVQNDATNPHFRCPKCEHQFETTISCPKCKSSWVPFNGYYKQQAAKVLAQFIPRLESYLKTDAEIKQMNWNTGQCKEFTMAVVDSVKKHVKDKKIQEKILEDARIACKKIPGA